MPERVHSDEVIEEYPELFRARELFIKLFADSRPLVNLGYTHQQTEYAKPCLIIIQECGVCGYDYLDIPSLRFGKRNEEKSVKIGLLPNNEGYYMDITSSYYLTIQTLKKNFLPCFGLNPLLLFFLMKAQW